MLIITTAGNCLSGTVSYVIHITIDAVGGTYLSDYLSNNPSAFPNFRRLQTQGAYTFNARCDYNFSETIPDHTTIVTGRPVYQPSGQPPVHHGYDRNDSPIGVTIHSYANPAVPYKASVFDVVHDNGLKVGLFLGKTRLSVITNSYNRVNGAPDTTGEDNGREKFDYYSIASTTPPLLNIFTNLLRTNPPNYTLFHIVEPDTVGHSSGWGSTAWSNSVIQVDGYIGAILDVVDKSPILSNRTAIIVVADHGGGGDIGGRNHMDATHPLNYTIPMFIWSGGFAPGSDLYSYFSNRANPGTTRPDESQPIQPLRNGDTSNLALMLLGLPEIPGSYWRPQLINTSDEPPMLIYLRQANILTLKWKSIEGYYLEFTEALGQQWQPITNGITSDGSNNILMLNIDIQSPSGFFRLNKVQ